MHDIISQLWNGSLVPVKEFDVHNAEMRELEVLMRRNSDALRERLNAQATGILEKYVDFVNEYLFVCQEQAFGDGYRLGARLTAEALFAGGT